MSLKLNITKKLNVDINETGFAFQTIGTDAVSTCHFYLLIVYLLGQRFAFLFHSDEDFPATNNSSNTNNSSSSNSPPTANNCSKTNTSSSSNSASTTNIFLINNSPSTTDNSSSIKIILSPSNDVSEAYNSPINDNSSISNDSLSEINTATSTLIPIVKQISNELETYLKSALKSHNLEFRFEMVQI